MGRRDGGNEERCVMKRNMIKAVIAAAALSTVVASFSAFAQSYGGGPTCGYRQEYDVANQRCVSCIGKRDDNLVHKSTDRPYPKQIDVVE
jgi:hypothetical protein